MQNCIIEVDDILIVASNIEDLLEAVVRNPETKMEVVFRVRTGLKDNVVNEELLKGKMSVISRFVFLRIRETIFGDAVNLYNNKIFTVLLKTSICNLLSQIILIYT